MNGGATMGQVGGSTILSVNSLRSGYGKKEVLHGVSFCVQSGSVVALIGPNGSGKSTLLKTVFGLLKATEGTIEFDRVAIAGAQPAALIQRGMCYLPQGNLVFPNLSVAENLTVSMQGLSKSQKQQRVEELITLFPFIGSRGKRLARELSGGEKQQVALASALIKKPRLLLLDEPSLGLAPSVLSGLFERMVVVSHKVGTTLLIVEHKVREVFRSAGHVIGLRRGEILQEGPPSAFDNDALKDLFLG